MSLGDTAEPLGNATTDARLKARLGELLLWFARQVATAGHRVPALADLCRPC